jgi:hypothetical protein
MSELAAAALPRDATGDSACNRRARDGAHLRQVGCGEGDGGCGGRVQWLLAGDGREGAATGDRRFDNEESMKQVNMQEGCDCSDGSGCTSEVVDVQRDVRGRKGGQSWCQGRSFAR